MRAKGKVVIFGAGATGRGHVGLLCWQAGLDLLFVDSDAALVRQLRQAGAYEVTLYGNRSQRVTVSGFGLYEAGEREAIAAEIASADLVLTAVFDPNLADVGETLALAVAACRESGRRRPLNCLACENMMDSSSVLRRHTEALLNDADRRYCSEYFGFPDCMISRVVPRPGSTRLEIVTEDYNEWTARADAFKGERPPGLTALELVDNQSARLERKLFIHNGGHAVCGYLGFHRGHRFIHEAVADPLVAEHVLKAMDEIGEVMIRKHGFSSESIAAYKSDLARRGSIAELRDEILRATRGQAPPGPDVRGRIGVVFEFAQRARFVRRVRRGRLGRHDALPYRHRSQARKGGAAGGGSSAFPGLP